jgi:hypothetical protein
MTSSHDGGGAKSRPSPQHSSSSSRPQQQTVKKQIEDYREMYTDVFPVILEAKKVKAMRFVDYYGDPGRYTGEVNDANMPHGMGEMTYDHGLVQGGTWVSLFCVLVCLLCLLKNCADGVLLFIHACIVCRQMGY